MKRFYRIFLWIIALAAAAFIMPILCNLIFGYFVARGLQQTLPLGWLYVIHRNFAEISLNWNLIGMAVVCSAMMLVIGHYLIKSLHAFAQNTETLEQPMRTWRWQWTLGLYAGLWILFAIACGAAGLRERISWLAKDARPWLEERMGAYYELRNADGEVQSLVAEKGGDLESTYRAFLAESSPGRRRQLYSDFMNLILYGDNHGKVAAYVMIPREPQLVKQGLFAVWTENPPDFSVKSRSELPGVIAAFDAKYPIKH